MSNAIAEEARRIVFEAAKPVRPGQTVASQIDAACKALGYPRGSWRITAAWYNQAGCWSAAAIADLQSRFVAWRDAEGRRVASAAAFAEQRRADADRAMLEQIRARTLADLARIEARLAVLPMHRGGDPV